MYNLSVRANNSLISDNEISVVFFGGGPGTDLFGVLASQDKLLGETEKRLHFQIFDQAASKWKDILDALLKDIPDLRFSYEYHTLRFPQPFLKEDESIVVFNL